LFTSPSHLTTALRAAAEAGIPRSKVFIFPITGSKKDLSPAIDEYKSIDDLVDEGRRLAPLPAIKWEKGRGRVQPAYLCYSSGTSGAPKGVIVSHRNIIANVMQMTLYESVFRPSDHHDTILGLLPQSHIYAIILTTHLPVFRGDTVIVMTKFVLEDFVLAIKQYKMTLLYVVPPMLIALTKRYAAATDKTQFELPSVQRIFCGAAPLSQELTSQIRKQYPEVLLGQGYGMTESATVITSHPKEVMDGSSGCIVPGLECKIIDIHGSEVNEMNKPGELIVRGPNVTIGYLRNEKATQETFRDGWLRTGDEAEFRFHPKTKDPHIFIVDRVKELIKVSGFQVAPAELEGHLLDHPLVEDCAVIPVHDERSGEVPKALVVLRKDQALGHEEARQQLMGWVANSKAKHKHLRGGVDFILEIPKSPSGKILRRFLRDREKQKTSRPMAKL
jgi:acyl-CoA synthetase (AMP-forming)/AMP-acid ligase II